MDQEAREADEALATSPESEPTPEQPALRRRMEGGRAAPSFGSESSLETTVRSLQRQCDEQAKQISAIRTTVSQQNESISRIREDTAQVADRVTAQLAPALQTMIQNALAGALGQKPPAAPPQPPSELQIAHGAGVLGPTSA